MQAGVLVEVRNDGSFRIHEIDRESVQSELGHLLFISWDDQTNRHNSLAFCGVHGLGGLAVSSLKLMTAKLRATFPP